MLLKEKIQSCIRIIILVLTKLSLEDSSKWYKYLDRIQRALHSTVQRSINLNIFEVLIGTTMRNKEDSL